MHNVLIGAKGPQSRKRERKGKGKRKNKEGNTRELAVSY